MVIALNGTGGILSKAQDFLRGSYKLLKTFVQVHDFLNSDLEAAYQTSESKDMGISIEQDTLLQLEEILQELNIGSLEDLMLQGHFGSGLCINKYINAVRSLAGYQHLVIKRANAIFTASDNLEPYSLKELRKLNKNIGYSLGDLVYALSNIIFDPLDARSLLEAKDADEEPITYSAELQQFFHEIHMQPEEFAKYLVELQHRFISVIPIYEDNPEAWEQITSQLHPSLVDTLTEYGTYITNLDIRAVKAGLLQIDENYLDKLSARAEDSEYIANADPEGWAAFVKLIPDKYIATFIALEDRLTPGLLESALQENKITDKYVEALQNFLKGDINGATKYFS